MRDSGNSTSIGERVKEYYANWTERYIESFGDVFQSHRADDLGCFFDYYIRSIGIRDGQKVLDAGCGVGGPVIQFAKRKEIDIDAVNISPLQLDIARQKINKESLKGSIHLYEGDFHHLQAVTGRVEYYDVIYFMESLVHSNDPLQVIAEVFSILKPGGVLYIKDLYRKPARFFWERWRINRSVKINNELFVLNIIPKEKLLQMLKEAGFQLVFCKPMDIAANQDIGNSFVVKNRLVKSITQWYPYLEWVEIKCIKPGVLAG